MACLLAHVLERGSGWRLRTTPPRSCAAAGCPRSATRTRCSTAGPSHTYDEDGYFVSRQVRPVTRKHIENLFDRIKRRLPWAQRHGLRPHDIRHSSARLLNRPPHQQMARLHLAHDAGSTTDHIARWSARCAREIRLHKLTQFLFFDQWQRCARPAARDRSEIMGDLPIFVAHDSADVWARRELFRLDADGRPTVLAGVPPDYFSATGQLWGNPHYRWDVLARDRIRLVDRRAFGRLLAAGRSRPHRSLPRIRGVVGGAGRACHGRVEASG